jgi:TRAP-type mannitol/chloroaromatic compound transport system permease small subunit
MGSASAAFGRAHVMTLMLQRMRKMIKAFFSLIDTITETISKPASLLVFAMMAVTTWEVVGRYVFNHPTIWAWPTNRQLFGLFILVAGSYTMSRKEHIRIEIIYDYFPPRLKMIARMTTLAVFILFMGVLIWQTAWMGWNSFMSRELLAGAFRIPLYPFKLLIPLGAVLLFLQGIAVFSRRDE